MTSLFQELFRAGRALRRSPAFTFAAACTLVLGMSAALLVLRLIDTTLVRPLPGVAEPERLVAITSTSISYPSLEDFRAAARDQIDLAGFQNRPLVVTLPGGASERVQGSAVSGRYFEVLGTRAAVGRLLAEADDRAGAPAATVLGYRFAERLGGASAVGRAVRINDVPFEIVGVAAEEFRGPQLAPTPQVFVSMHAWAAARPTSFARLDLSRRSWSWINAFGRLRPGVDAAAAAAALNVSAARQEHDYPNETRTGFAVTVSPATMAAVGVRTLPAAVRFAGLLSTAALLVLLLACANVANLMLARGESRRRDLLTRMALGAGRAQIALAVLGEAILLAALAAAGGLAMVAVAARALASVRLPGGGGGLLLGAFDLRPDGRLLAAAALLTLLASAVFGILPALRAGRKGLNTTLREAAVGRRGGRLSGSLVAVQVALGVVLLAGAGLLGRALSRAGGIDTGMRTANVALANVDLGLARYDAPRAAAGYPAALAAVSALPGVSSAAWALTVPLTDDEDTESITVPGYTPAPDEHPEVEIDLVGRDYFSVLGLRRVAGRFFDAGDRAGASPVAVVNEAFARRYLAGREVAGVDLGLVGRHVRLVGVVADTQRRDLLSPVEPCVFVAFETVPPDSTLAPMTLLVRTAGEPQNALGAIDRALRQALPGAPIYSVATFDDLYAALLAPQRFGAGLLGLFGSIGLLLAAIGVWSVVSYAASRRQREVGVRGALGATPRAIVALFVGESMRRVAWGVVAGLLCAAGLAQGLRALLYGISPLDPVTYAAVAITLLAVAGLAAFLPARRAAAVDPARVLRAD